MDLMGAVNEPRRVRSEGAPTEKEGTRQTDSVETKMRARRMRRMRRGN
jgi:hypothetical protein